MKRKTILLLFACIMAGVANAQEYIPLAVENAQWIVAFDDNSTPIPYDALWEYRVMGDTVVNDFDYKKVYRRGLIVDYNYPVPPFTPEEEFFLYGLVRDDQLDRKVYAVKYYNTLGMNECPVDEEYLLYDFSLYMGDTFQNCLTSMWEEYVITDIYQEEYYFDFETNIYLLDNWLLMFEGIGTEFGLFEEIFNTLKANETYVVRTFLSYYCRNADSCELTVNIPEHEIPKTLFTIYPSPANNKITIQCGPSFSTEKEVAIVNLQGKTVLTQQIDIVAETQIDVRKLANGLYITSLIEGGKVIAKQKLIINH